MDRLRPDRQGQGTHVADRGNADLDYLQSH